MHIGKKEVKQSLFEDDMILYIENAKYSTKKTIRNNKQIGRVQNQYEKKSKIFKSRSLTLHSDLVTLVTNREEQRS